MKDELKIWLARTRTALVLIDMQVDFAKPEGAMGKNGADMSEPQAAVRQAERLADAARNAAVPCVFVRLVTRPGDESPFIAEWKRRRDDDDVPLCLEGSEGAEFTGPMPRGGELVFSKRRYNAFQDTGLDIALRGEDIDTLVMAGLTTDCCIDSSVRAAFERDYHVYVVGDATACYQPGLHQATLEALALNCATILSVDDVISAWK